MTAHVQAATSAASAGTAAEWTAAAGIWVIGALAVWIAVVQYRQVRFRPTVWAYRDNDGRILVRIVNQGSGSGFVDQVSLLPQDHDRTGRAERYDWELAGAASADRPVPFPLAGGASAQLFLLPSTTAHPRSLRVRVEFGAGADSGCRPINGVTSRLYGSTVIPGVTQPPTSASSPWTPSPDGRSSEAGPLRG
jgi:hypothetical protein